MKVGIWATVLIQARLLLSKPNLPANITDEVLAQEVERVRANSSRPNRSQDNSRGSFCISRTSKTALNFQKSVPFGQSLASAMTKSASRPSFRCSDRSSDAEEVSMGELKRLSSTRVFKGY